MEVKYIDVNTQKESEWVDVFLIACVHEGNCNHAEDAFKESVKLIEKNIETNPYTFVILMGDLVDAIVGTKDPRWNPVTVADKYEIRDLKDLPKKQADHMFENLKPIKDRVIAVLCGNHEESYVKHYSSDIYDYIGSLFPFAKKLGRKGFVSFRLRYQRTSAARFTFALLHGTGGGGKTIGYTMNKIYDLFRFTRNCEFKVGAHYHRSFAKPIWEEGPTAFGNFQKFCVQYGSCGAYLWKSLEGTTSYAETRDWPESDIGMLKASFRVRRQRIKQGEKRLFHKETRLEEILFNSKENYL